MNPTNGLAGRLLTSMCFTRVMIVLLTLTWLTLEPANLVTAQENVAPDGSLSAEPYSVYVAQEATFARCGPSGEFYRTDPLRHGQELEVYVETADGWLGIRPPDDSFCWVPASSIKLSGSSDQATVTEDHTVAWIGTHLGRARRYRWQVQLAEGEPVTIVGKSERDGPDGPQMWYRIVPPSGEFRWVHRDQIVTTPEQLVASVTAQQEDDDTIDFLPRSRPTRPVHEDQFVQDEQPLDDETEAPIGSGVRDDWQANETPNRAIDSLVNRQALMEVPRPAPDTEPEATPSSLAFASSPRLQNIGAAYETMTPATTELASDSNWVGSGTRHVAQASYTAAPSPVAASQSNMLVQTAALSDNVGHVAQSLHTVDTAAVARVESEVAGASVEKLQLMLSRIMAAGASTEEAEPIAQSAERIARTAVDDLEARRAQAIADRTRQYQRVAQRRDGHRVSLSAPSPLIPTNNVQLAQAPAYAPSAFGTPAIAASSRHNAAASLPPMSSNAQTIEAGEWMSESGYLVQVYSARTNSPPFALTDNGGRTLAYVTPVPGTNLRMHLNNHIRVEGQRGFVNGMDTPHIMANRAQRVAE